MAAVTAVFETVRAGQHVAAPQVMYHGTADWLRRMAETRGVAVTFFDQTAPGALEAEMRSAGFEIVETGNYPQSPIGRFIAARAV